MIVQVTGTLLSKELERVEIMTGGGVAYELLVPLNVYETLPKPGETATLHTYLVVKEDGWQLFGFATALDRRVFHRVLGAKGVGPALALGLLSTLSAERLVRAIREKDITTLQSVPRVGRKKAEQLVLDLADKLDDVQVVPLGAPRPEGVGVEDAVRALVSLGYSPADAERAVRAALDDGVGGGGGARGLGTPELIRRALARVGGR